MARALILGCSGLSLTADERNFFRQTEPWGLILFARNCDTPAQITSLIRAFRECVGRNDAPVLIDQEGGRVQRLGPPHWPAYPPAQAFADAYRRDPQLALDMAVLAGRCIGADLRQIGITVDCAPVADVPIPGSHDIIGDRAFGRAPDDVTLLAGAMAEGLRKSGICPVIKHIPGHGRALSDSHKDLPVVSTTAELLAQTDFVPFKRLSDLPAAMTAHVIYSEIDPELPATHSKPIIEQVIRGQIGFDGLLMSDDLSMHALTGPFDVRAALCFTAGVDIALHCNGDMAEMQAVAAGTPVLSGVALKRAAAVTDIAGAPAVPVIDEMRAKLLNWAQESQKTG